MTFFARMMTPTAPMTAMISVFKFSSGCVTAEVPVPAAKQVVPVVMINRAFPDVFSCYHLLSRRKKSTLTLLAKVLVLV